MTNKVVIILDNGIVREVISNQEVSVTVLDGDVDGIEEVELHELFGEQFYIYEGIKKATVDKNLIKEVYGKTKGE